MSKIGSGCICGHAALDVVNRDAPVDIADPQEFIACAMTLSLESDTTASSGIEDINAETQP